MSQELPPSIPLPNHYAPYTLNTSGSMQINRFAQLCNEIFVQNHLGQEFMHLLETLYLMPRLFNPTHPRAGSLALYTEGQKDLIRAFKEAAQSHQQREINERNKQPEQSNPFDRDNRSSPSIPIS